MDTDHHEKMTPRSGAASRTTKPTAANARMGPVPGRAALAQAKPTATDRPFLLLEAWLRKRYASRHRYLPR